MKKLNIVYILAVVLLLGSCSSGNNAEWKQYNKKEHLQSFNVQVLTAEELTDIIVSEDTAHFRLIDVRTHHKFAEGHAPNAINIPLRKLYDPKYSDILCQDKKVNVFYGEDPAQGKLAAMILAHYGFKNNVAALGGYDFIQNHIINNFGIYSNVYDDEKAVYDYAKVIAETPGASAGSSGSVAPAPAPKPIAHKKKKQAAAGGCE